MTEKEFEAFIKRMKTLSILYKINAVCLIINSILLTLNIYSQYYLSATINTIAILFSVIGISLSKK